jgi:hypothetical protein
MKRETVYIVKNVYITNETSTSGQQTTIYLNKFLKISFNILFMSNNLYGWIL